MDISVKRGEQPGSPARSTMKQSNHFLSDGLFTLVTLLVTFCTILFLQNLFDSRTLTPMIFVLGVYLVSWRTQGYFWGIAASLISVLAVNYAFTYPYWAFDLISPECIASAVVMLIVSTMTGALTTRLKQQEKLKAEAETERMRGNLLRAVSHDLRTPLTAIYGACSAMMENYDTFTREKHLKMLAGVSADAQWLVRMVENLLSITRIDAGVVDLKKQDTVLEELIDSLLVKFRKHYPEQIVQVSLPEEFVLIPMDAILIEQVLMNLLENAVFHAKGMKNLWLRVEIDQDTAVFRVEDDGAGIPAEQLPRLFTSHLTADTPSDSSRSSMGIGLSVCSTIIKAHGSQIYAQNRPEGGACFYFALKLEDTGNVEQ